MMIDKPILYRFFHMQSLHWCRNTLAAVVTLVVTAAPAMVHAAPKADLWERWQAHDPASTDRIDHSAWNHVLSSYVKPDADGVNRFDYGGVRAADRAALDGYIGSLAGTTIGTFNRKEQFAYWVNFYNALTVRVVLDHYPVESILDIDISPGWFSRGPWGAKLVTVEGEELSLDDIEHRILRPIWRDPRIHYVVNCASIGCPNLPPVALSADNAEQILEKAAVAYVNHPRGVRFDGNDLIVSSIYSWFEEDFGSSEKGVIMHLRRFAKPPLEERLNTRNDYTDHGYDWNLNGL